MSDPTIEHASGRDAIFISYRRGDTAYPAGWLYHQLVEHFGADQVFKDVDSIELGSDFVAEITTAVSACHCLLALIGRDWLTAVDQRGRRRLDDPADFVRIEIEAALSRGVRVVPVLVEDATMPYADELPPTLAPITRRQALVLSPTRFTADIAKLIGVLERTFAEAAAAREAERAAASATASVALDERGPAAEPVREDETVTPPAVEEVAHAEPVVEEAAAPEAEVVRAAPEAEVARAEPEVARAEPVVVEEAVHAEPAVAAKAAEVKIDETKAVGATAGKPHYADVEKPVPAAPEGAERPSRGAAFYRGSLLLAPILFLVALFLPWANDEFLTRDGFSSPLLALAWILLLAAAVWVRLPSLGASGRILRQRSFLALTLVGVALLCTVFVLFQIWRRGTPDIGGLGLGPLSSRTAGPGAYLGLLVVAVTTVALGVLLLRAGGKGADVTLVRPPADKGARIRSASGLVSLVVAAVVGLSTHPTSAADGIPAPYEGDHMWWSFYGNFLGNTLETTDSFDISVATDVYLNAEINYEAEEGYDYLVGEVSTDSGETWTVLNGTINGEAIWSDGDEILGLDDLSPDADENGESDWVPLIYDLTAWAGESQVWFRFRYITDHGYAPKGFFIDKIVIFADGGDILFDGAEAGDGPWTTNGFVRVP